MKITGFAYENKYSVKFEKYHLEQWFKFRDGSVESIAGLQEKIVPSLLEGVEVRFQSMVKDRADAVTQSIGSEGDIFDEII